MLSGGLFATKQVPNYMNTCVIDATILSIVNSDALCNQIIDMVKDEINVNSNQLMKQLLKEQSKYGFFDILKTIQHLIGAYIILYYGKNEIQNISKWKNVLDWIRSHILFLMNRHKFTRIKAKDIDKDYNKHSLNEQYVIYTTTMIDTCAKGDLTEFNKYAYTDIELIKHIFDSVFEDYEDYVSWKRVRSYIKLYPTDVYLRFPTYEVNHMESSRYDIERFNKIYKYANTYHNDRYLCTDMILRQVIDGKPYGTHLVYYNLLECHLENNDVVYYVPPHRLIIGNREEDGKVNEAFVANDNHMPSVFIPEVLHFQKVPMIKTKALSCGYIDENDDTRFIGNFNLLRRLELVRSLLNGTSPLEIMAKRKIKYINDVEKAIGMLKGEADCANDIGELSYSITERFVSIR